MGRTGGGVICCGTTDRAATLISRLHPSLVVTRTISGRPATRGLPVLGLPKRSEEGRRIRSLVRAPKGCVILSLDYSQIELRIAAHLSGDETLIAEYRNGEDRHANTAERVFGIPKDKQDKSRHRLPAKVGNFGYWMGLEAKGLTEAIHKEGLLEWSKDCPGCKQYRSEHAPDCDSVKFFKEFDRAYPGARKYQDARREHARCTGYAFGLWGEQWFLPGVWSPHADIREATERQAFAIPVQSGNARLIKQAMATVWESDLPWARQLGIRVEPILWVHDELLFVVGEDGLKAWATRVKVTMENVATLSVPIVAEGSYGPSWLEQTELNG